MPSRSALARLQQATTIFLLSSALAWLAWHWRDSPAMALTGFVLIAFGYAVFLAVEFVAMRFVGGGDPAPLPTWGELGRAWLAETIAAPRVFCWRQPFRWREVPDHLAAAPGESGRRGVVLIHGFVCNRGFWTPWLKELRAGGHCFVAVNLCGRPGSSATGSECHTSDVVPNPSVTDIRRFPALSASEICH